ncbi:hypothetical protein LZG04_11040 [Saccharothrix sp. S26]|uniref:hypothetical protein n=1 Tax=Saccharothrix sp. S26 TaxID=2907215 RepID=UPI001F3EDC6F|nr:hypothetical protein [Saccharothrix sp. S26]MCE6995341.1 hypothetical protein [Saccharothrix sp. S26]
MAAALTVTTTAAAMEDIPVERIVFQTTDEDNIDHLRVVLCAKATGATTYQLTIQLLTPDEPLPPRSDGTCMAHRITDIPGAQQILDSVHLDPDGTRETTARATDDYDAHEVGDITKDKPAVIQDVAESTAIENIQVGLVNVQDVANRNGNR